MECYCAARNKPVRREITKPQTETVNSLWFWGLLKCPELYCDWSVHNQHSWNFSGVHGFPLSLTVNLEGQVFYWKEWYSLKAESEKRGLGSSTETWKTLSVRKVRRRKQRLCDKQRRQRGWNVFYEKLLLVAEKRLKSTMGQGKVKRRSFWAPYKMYASALVIISLPSPTFHCMFIWLPLFLCSSCVGRTKSKTSTLFL